MKPNLIADIDGTLTIPTKKDPEESWNDYFARAEPNWETIELVKELSKVEINGSYSEREVYYITSRMESARLITRDQLHDWGLIPEYGRANFRLLMRKQDDHRDDFIIKLEYCEEYNLTPENTHLVLEDLDHMVKAYRDAGFEVRQIK